jgi:hypothetical protein
VSNRHIGLALGPIGVLYGSVLGARALGAAAVLCMGLAGALAYVAGPVTVRRRS